MKCCPVRESMSCLRARKLTVCLCVCVCFYVSRRIYTTFSRDWRRYLKQATCEGKAPFRRVPLIVPTQRLDRTRGNKKGYKKSSTTFLQRKNNEGNQHERFRGRTGLLLETESKVGRRVEKPKSKPYARASRGSRWQNKTFGGLFLGRPVVLGI